jgi:hypothetical protein
VDLNDRGPLDVIHARGGRKYDGQKPTTTIPTMNALSAT